MRKIKPADVTECPAAAGSPARPAANIGRVSASRPVPCPRTPGARLFGLLVAAVLAGPALAPNGSADLEGVYR